MNVHVLYVLEHKTSTHKIPSVCLSVCLAGCMQVDSGCGHNNFRRSQGIQTKFGGCILCMKCRASIGIQSKIMIMIMILILNRVSILTKTLRNDTQFGGYLQYIKHNHAKIRILILIRKKNSEKSLRIKTKFHDYH